MLSRIKELFIDTYATRSVDKPMVVLTHDGIFHADEVAAIAILKLYIEFNKCSLEIIRSRNEAAIDSADLVFDIGMRNEGKFFDHHQPLAEADCHENGIPLATAGLVWKDIGFHLIKYIAIRQVDPEIVTVDFINNVWKKMDTKLFMPIDATDSGVNVYKDLDFRPVDVSSVISMFNNYQSVNQEKQFYKALKLMGTIIHNFMMTLIKQLNGEKVLLDILNLPENKYNDILIMPKYVNNWKDIIDDHFELFNQYKVALYPGDDEPNLEGKQTWRITSLQKDRYNGFSVRCPAPIEWQALKGDELRRVTKHNCLAFIHKNGFMGGGFGTKQEFLYACKTWIHNSPEQGEIVR